MRIIVLLLLILSTTAYAEENESAPPQVEYLPLDPKFVVNLEGRKRYLRVDIQLMIEGEQEVEKISTHIPALRHSLIMLFSSYRPDQLATPDQREQFRKSALEDVGKTLEKYADSKGLTDLFFTEFLVQ